MRENLQDRIFLKGIKHRLFLFYLPMFIVFKKMYSQNDETGVKQSKSKFLYCPTMVQKPLQNSLKILSIDFKIQWWYLCEFLGEKRVRNIKISLSAIISYCQNWEEIQNCKKQYTMKVLVHELVGRNGSGRGTKCGMVFLPHK